MFTDADPFKDNNVRLALKYGVDRKVMVQTILHGHGVPGNDHPITPANRFYAAGLPVREYDPEQARFHLKQAGLAVAQGRSSVPPMRRSWARSIPRSCSRNRPPRPASTSTCVRAPDDGYWTKVWTKQPFVMCFWGGRPTEDWMFSQVYAKDAPWNDTHWEHERFNRLLVEARAELDEAKRRTLYQRDAGRSCATRAA